jgi:hypothetical protein
MLKQYTEENKVLSKEKTRLEAVSKERQSLYEEESQKQRMQYQRLLEELKCSINQSEQKLEEKIGEYAMKIDELIKALRSINGDMMQATSVMQIYCTRLVWKKIQDILNVMINNHFKCCKNIYKSTTIVVLVALGENIFVNFFIRGASAERNKKSIL